jgi:hypothetical protein
LFVHFFISPKVSITIIKYLGKKKSMFKRYFLKK